ncbi:MAG: hypothetical protein DSY89_09785 [Deltaproteobacteria bacterium]|nr:MAG: hypothetical protein DSY89_09785 [Deltaproteobacteria bacterium]
MAEQQQNIDNYTKGFGYALIVAMIFNGVLTILKEKIEAIHDVLALVFWHHWIGHGVVVLAVFVILGFLFSKSAAGQEGGKLATWVVWGAVIGSGLIVMFFTIKILA